MYEHVWHLAFGCHSELDLAFGCHGDMDLAFSWYSDDMLNIGMTWFRSIHLVLDSELAIPILDSEVSKSTGNSGIY